MRLETVVASAVGRRKIWNQEWEGVFLFTVDPFYCVNYF